MQRNPMMVMPLVQNTMQASQALQLDARKFANVVYGAARSGIAKTRSNELNWTSFAALARAAERCMHKFNP